MIIQNLIKQINNYRNIMIKKNQTVGSILKHNRINNRLTLEETANNICSVSYLCKVENNQIIPSEVILPKIIKRLGLKEADLLDNYQDDWIEAILNDHLYAKKLLEGNEARTDYKTKLIRFANYILNEYDEGIAYGQFIELTDYFEHLKEEEMCFYLYLSILLFDKREAYYDVVSLANEVYKFNKNTLVLALTKIIELKAIYKLGIKAQISIYYNNAINLLIEENRYDLIYYPIKYQMALMAKHLPLHKLETNIKRQKNINEIDLCYIYFVYYFFNRKDYKKAYQYSDKLKDLGDHYFIMNLLTLYKLKRQEDIIKVINNIQMPLRKTYQYIIEFITSDYDERLKLVRNKLLNAHVNIEEKVIADFVYQESYALFKKRYLYKECTTLLEKYNRIIKQASGMLLLSK